MYSTLVSTAVQTCGYGAEGLRTQLFREFGCSVEELEKPALNSERDVKEVVLEFCKGKDEDFGRVAKEIEEIKMRNPMYTEAQK